AERIAAEMVFAGRQFLAASEVQPHVRILGDERGGEEGDGQNEHAEQEIGPGEPCRPQGLLRRPRFSRGRSDRFGGRRRLGGRWRVRIRPGFRGRRRGQLHDNLGERNNGNEAGGQAAGFLLYGSRLPKVRSAWRGTKCLVSRRRKPPEVENCYPKNLMAATAMAATMAPPTAAATTGQGVLAFPGAGKSPPANGLVATARPTRVPLGVCSATAAAVSIAVCGAREGAVKGLGAGELHGEIVGAANGLGAGRGVAAAKPEGDRGALRTVPLPTATPASSSSPGPDSGTSSAPS